MRTLKIPLNSYKNWNWQFSKKNENHPTLVLYQIWKIFKNYIFFNDKVKPPIIMYLSLNIFQYFLHSLIKLSDFCVVGHPNLKATNDLWTLKAMEQCIKHKKRINDNLVQFFWKISSRPLFSFSPISSSF
jgi:hypothetical protein